MTDSIATTGALTVRELGYLIGEDFAICGLPDLALRAIRAYVASHT